MISFGSGIRIRILLKVSDWIRIHNTDDQYNASFSFYNTSGKPIIFYHWAIILHLLWAYGRRNLATILLSHLMLSFLEEIRFISMEEQEELQKNVKPPRSIRLCSQGRIHLMRPSHKCQNLDLFSSYPSFTVFI
jgi:hypothetical protein